MSATAAAAAADVPRLILQLASSEICWVFGVTCLTQTSNDFIALYANGKYFLCVEYPTYRLQAVRNAPQES